MPVRLARLLSVGACALGVVVLASSLRAAKPPVLAVPDSILVMPGPAKGARAKDRLDRNDDCVACHPDVGSEWSHSLHRQSFRDPMFQQALAREQNPGFCRSCHAPEADPKREPTEREADAGVSCVGCHVTGSSDDVLAAPDPGADDTRVPHSLRRAPEFASTDACARCHEFWFPGGDRAGEELKMQRTVAEHARSEFADESCQSCHMSPARSGGAVHRGHRFAVVGQPAMLRAAVSIDARRPTPGRVEIELAPRLVGHAFPTGDLFRRLVVEVRATGESEWSQSRYLARHFGVRRVGEGGPIKVERSDDRVGIGTGPRQVEFEIPAELQDQPIGWTLVYERVLEAAAGAERRADIWDRTPIASGTLTPSPPS